MIWTREYIDIDDRIIFPSAGFSHEHGSPASSRANVSDGDFNILATIQAAVAICLLCTYVVFHIYPRCIPQWCNSFAKEGAAEQHNLRKKRRTYWTLCLIGFAILGLALSIISVASSRPWNIIRLLDIIPWISTILITLLDKPIKTPKVLLILYLTICSCGFANVLLQDTESEFRDELKISTAAVAGIAVLAILFMPLRDPTEDASSISGRHTKPTSDLRSPEDNLTLWQYMSVSWMSPLMSVAREKQLNNEDVWQLPYEFQHDRLHTLFKDLKGSLLKRIIRANALDLVIMSILGITESVSNLSVPILLQKLLQAIGQKNAVSKNDRSSPFIFAAIILLVRMVGGQVAVFSLWYSRRAYERSRGEMITTIYAKTLTRKSFGMPEDEEKTKTSDSPPDVENGSASDDESKGRGLVAILRSWLRFRKTSKSKVDSTNQPASMGKVLNLMRNDVYEVAQRFWEFPALITKPSQLIFSTVLIWKFLGWPCLLGIACVIVAQILNAIFVRQVLKQEKLRRVATDTRLQATSQFVEAIRHLRWYDWQSSWIEKIMSARSIELKIRVITSIWRLAISTINMSAGLLFPVASFFAYTFIAGNALTVDIAFPALQLFSMLESGLKEIPNLITVFLNASVAMGRLEDFMQEPDKEDGFSDSVSSKIQFRDASFAWPGSKALPVLQDLNFDLSEGFNVVLGKVGCGKSALLGAILGELDTVGEGDCVLPNETIGYCAQSPWLQHMSIRDNILFAASFDPQRYQEVIDACALAPDFVSFKHGDLSNIGENGIGLSGGQKARVALARAVYSRARILLLDDPLAALDHNTAESIVKKLFQGSLVKDRTVVLVTHRVDLCAHLADQIVEIVDGRARIISQEEAAKVLPFLTTLHENKSEDTKEGEKQTPERDVNQQDSTTVDKFIEDEHRATGGIVVSTYWAYIKAGKLKLWVFLITTTAIFRIARQLNYWFLKDWGEAYNTADTSKFESQSVNLVDRLPSPNKDVKPWLLVYLLIALLHILMYILNEGTILLIVYVAAKDLFERVLQKVGQATFRFYDVTPVGRLMNRLTSDIGMLDGGIIAPLENCAWYGIAWIISMSAIASITPLFLIFSICLTAWFFYIFLQFLPASQSLRRLETVSLSPLMSNFGILVDGLATIRAFKAQSNFQNRNIEVVDDFQKMDHFYWSLQSWLSYRFRILSASATFALTLLALYSKLSPGLTAFILTSASNFVIATQSLCRYYGQLQMDFVSVERVVELLELEEEPVGDIQPPAAWPAYGDDIVFEGVTIKYAPHLDPSLEDVSFTIPGGSTCAVLGRTGSGKSTLALALLATVRPESGGEIRVGSMDIGKVNVHTWRQRISFVSQDPVLFPGTLRQNLDPLNEYTDLECVTVLHRILGSSWTLESNVDTGGKNLSQGERQLVGIVRAVLRRSPVVILDEATASIDTETAMKIQEILRDELKESTVITIAHRLEVVKDADWCIKVDNGKVIACGPARNIDGEEEAEAEVGDST